MAVAINIEGRAVSVLILQFLLGSLLLLALCISGATLTLKVIILQEQQVEDLMRNSGDSSQQLTILNDELKEKTRFVLPIISVQCCVSEYYTRSHSFSVSLLWCPALHGLPIRPLYLAAMSALAVAQEED